MRFGGKYFIKSIIILKKVIIARQMWIIFDDLENFGNF
jgi:hypothetical protein